MKTIRSVLPIPLLTALAINCHAEKKYVATSLLIDYDKNNQIVSVEAQTNDPIVIIRELQAVYESHPFRELLLPKANLTPDLIAYLVSLSEVTHLTLGMPPEGIFLPDKEILERLTEMKNLRELSICINGLKLEEIHFLTDIWKVTIFRPG